MNMKKFDIEVLVKVKISAEDLFDAMDKIKEDFKKAGIRPHSINAMWEHAEKRTCRMVF
jgi:hypothetical protein